MNACIIAVNYFASELFSNLIEISDRYNLDLVVVDNSCDEGERGRLERVRGTRGNVHIVCNPVNNGFGSGCDDGVRYAKSINAYGIFLFVNPDIKEGDLTLLDESLADFMANKEAGYFQPLIEDARGDLSILGVKRANLCVQALLYTHLKPIVPRLRKLVVRIKDIRAEKTPIYIPSGAFFIVKSNVLDLIGGFPRDNFLYFEEWHFAHRVSNFGFEGYIDNRLSVNHLLGYTTGDRGCGTVGMLKLRRKSFRNSVLTLNKGGPFPALSLMLVQVDFLLRAMRMLIWKFFA